MHLHSWGQACPHHHPHCSAVSLLALCVFFLSSLAPAAIRVYEPPTTCCPRHWGCRTSSPPCSFPVTPSERREKDGRAALQALSGRPGCFPAPCGLILGLHRCSSSLRAGNRCLRDASCPHKQRLLKEAGRGATTCLAEGSPGLSPLTVAVLLAWVGDQPAIVRSRGHQVWDAVIVIVVITLVANSILVSVQLGTVNDSGAVVRAVLVPVSVTVGERRGGWRHRSAEGTTRGRAGVWGRNPLVFYQTHRSLDEATRWGSETISHIFNLLEQVGHFLLKVITVDVCDVVTRSS